MALAYRIAGMMRGLILFRALRIMLLAMAVVSPHVAAAHGSVTPDDDLCLIKIGYFKAHFKVYQPSSSGHEDYCEDLPGEGESIFVMEYEHSGLGSAPIDFRIIRNVTDRGVYTSLDDVRAIDDLDAVTVFHHPSAVQPDVFTIMHRFDSPGEFVGIVSVQGDAGRQFTAVFPFEVGYIDFGYWPLIVIAAIALQVNYLWMNGWFDRRRRERLRKRLKVVGGSAGG